MWCDQMTDTPTISPKPSSSPVPPSANDTQAPSASDKPKTPPNGKSKVKFRARPRRRVANSDVESEAEDAASDDSLTEHSASEQSDDEEDEDAVEDAVDNPSPDPGKPEKPVFADASSTTPAAWAGEKVNAEVKGEELVEMSFEEFNRGGRGRPVRGRGAGVAPVEGRKKREYTEEETRKFEVMKAKKKEKQKARKAEMREAKRKEKEGVKVEPKGMSARPQYRLLTSAAAQIPKPAESSTKPNAKTKAPKPKGKKKLDGAVSAAIQ